MLEIETKTTSQIIYERIFSIYNSLKQPVSLWQVYQSCRKDGYSIWQIRGSLKWLFDNGFLKWEGDGHLIPLKEVKTDAKQE